MSVLLGAFGDLLAQSTDDGFVVRNACMVNPACETDSTSFSDTLTAAVAWQWDFGDPASSRTDTRRNPRHLYNTPGPYTVSLTRTLGDGSIQTVQQLIEVGELPMPFQNWFADTTICPGNTLTLDPYPQGAPEGATYIWYPKGDTTQVLEVDSSGCYSVEVIMPNGCKIQDLVNVKICLEPAGQEGAKWFFGSNAGLDFASGTPQPIMDGKLNTKEGSSTISNSKGELLFYSDGITIYNADGDEMPCLEGDCEDLKGSSESTQSVLIVPQPTCRGCEYLYNVFTTTSINATDKVLTVSVVDMRRENGKGAIIEQNTILADNTTERLVSSRNDQDTTYWVLSHDYGTNRFRVFHATTAGLTETGTFDLGTSHDATSQGEGQMKFSSADSTGQRQLAVVVPGPPTNYLDLFGFNDEDGQLTFNRTLELGPSPPTAYGVEFSPDGTKLYVSFMGEGSAASKLVQYDLSLADDSLIVASGFTIDSSATETFGSLQTAPDGKIYMAVQGSEYLAVIGEPDDSTRTLGRLEYEREGAWLGTRKSELGLPNFVQNFTQESDGPGFDAEGFCVNEPTTFTASPLCQPIEDTYFWNFGDGGTASGKETEVTHTYREPGIYTVTLTAQNECKDTTFTMEVEIFSIPEELDLGGYIEDCRPELVLESNVEAETYVWVDLSTRRIVSRDRSYTVLPPGGDFALYIWNDPDGNCWAADTVNVFLRRPPAFDLGPDTTLCLDSTVVITSPGLAWREFTWNTGATSRDLVVSQPGTYWVEVKDANNCYNADTIEIAARPKAQVIADLIGPTGCTTRDGSIEIRSISPGPPNLYTYEWRAVDGTSLGSNVQVLSNLAEGAYTLRISGHPDACTSDTTLQLRSPANNLNMVPVIADASCTDPESGAITLNVLSGSPVTYQWWDSSGAGIGEGDTLSGLAPGVYSMRARDAGGCTFSLTGLTVGLEQNNLADLGPDLGRCVGDAVELEPLAVDFPHNNYLWSTGETTRTITVEEDGRYTLTAWNTENGCKGEDEIVVRSSPEPAVNLPAEYGLCMDMGNDSVLLSPSGRNDYRYYWPHSQDSLRQVWVDQLGVFTVQVTNVEGCTVEKSTTVRDKCEPRLVIPEAFSPNGDGRNDVLDIIGLYLTDFDLKIYNRWGEVIFASGSIDHKWDGVYRNLKVQPGVYAWVATYKSSDYPERPRYEIRGAVTVIR